MNWQDAKVRKYKGNEGEPCRLMVIYEDHPSRDHAIHVSDHLQQQFAGDVVFDISWWKFNLLADSLVASQFTDIIAHVDLIFVSVSLAHELPINVKHSLESALTSRTKFDGAFVLLQTSPTDIDQASQLGSYLQLLARRTNLDFFPLSHFDSLSKSPGQIRMAVSAETLPVNQFMNNHHQAWGWGINE
jgi:hypothetical protein